MRYFKLFTLVLLTAISHSSFAQLPDDAKDISPLLIGEEIPDITLVNTSNVSTNLQDVFKQQPTVLVFYRGGWCPYCNAHLKDLAAAESEILKAGYQIVAVSPDEPEQLNITADKKDVKYTLLSDGDGSLTRAMGIAFKAPDKKWKSNQLQKYSGGKNTGFLPVPSVFVVDKKGKILFEYIAPNYAHRMSADLLLAVLKSL